MCCCLKPNVNGTPGAYSWDGKTFLTREPNPPPLGEADTLLWDEPGRCGGIDCHSHHFRLVSRGAYSLTLLVRHGGGDERVPLPGMVRHILPMLDGLSSDQRFWLLHSLYSTYTDAKSLGTLSTASMWRQAAAEKRIKTRKKPRTGMVRVWIEPKPAEGVPA